MATTRRIVCNFVIALAAVFVTGCEQRRESELPAEFAEKPDQPVEPVPQQWQLCVDDKGNVVDDKFCEESEKQAKEQATLTSAPAGGETVVVQNGNSHLPLMMWMYMSAAQPVPVGGSISGFNATREPVGAAPIARQSAFTPSHPNHPAFKGAASGTHATARGMFGGTSASRGSSAAS